MKCGVDLDELSNMIDRITFIADSQDNNSEVQKTLKRVLYELSDYSERMYDKISSKILETSNQIVGEIVCALLENGTEKMYLDFQKISALVDNNIVFIDADYEQLRKIVGENEEEKIYAGIYENNNVSREFKYKLIFTDALIQEQEIVKKMDSIYNINNPIVYSPYSRKVFRIVTDEVFPEKCKIDYQFEKNGLKNVIQTSNVYWNLKISSTGLKAYDEKIPYGSNIKYKYIIKKSKSGKWYYAIPKNNQTIIYDVELTNEGTIITLNCELEDFTLIEYQVIDWSESNIKKLYAEKRLFSNLIDKKFSKRRNRIISMGDVQQALHPFRENNNVTCEIAENLEKPFLRYSSKYKAQDNKSVSYRISMDVKILFDSKCNVAFLDDYANYVLMYLDYYYPEIRWIGGI